MIDDISDIAAYYNSDPGREHGRLEQHQLEYDLTWRYLDQYLPSQGAILEIGAATRRYTLELARRSAIPTSSTQRRSIVPQVPLSHSVGLLQRYR